MEGGVMSRFQARKPAREACGPVPLVLALLHMRPHVL